ncbi:hypothetical protein H4219_002012 [Mycoemilia scoparia]|uniref:Protein kinase domain-containing protein n=1 Tax=Mycoemilia scoparia TaxID=417184 RepID=A0A9W8DV06_9FUNG|nr:hypothetical protein H4219_002012 [Mycoemilia scoparia]
MGFKLITKHIDDALECENWFTLNKRIKADLIVLCQERGLVAEGSKQRLIEELMDWKINAKPIPAPSSPHLEQRHTREPTLFSHPDSQKDTGETSDEINYQDLKLIRKIGSGGFKDCYEGTYNDGPVAIGEIRIGDFSADDFREIKHEISVLKQLRHENIVRFIGVCTNLSHLCIVTELCGNGDLFDYMRKTQKPTFGQLMMYMHDIALGVSYLHTRRPSVIHRDLKSMNILISSDNRAKINDFGLARIRPRMNTMVHTACGTPNWQAPEFWASRPSYTEKVDILQNRYYPDFNTTNLTLPWTVRDHGYRPPLTKIQKYPKELLNLIQEMWAQNPKERPPMTQVVERLLDYLS